MVSRSPTKITSGTTYPFGGLHVPTAPHTAGTRGRMAPTEPVEIRAAARLQVRRASAWPGSDRRAHLYLAAVAEAIEESGDGRHVR